MRHPSSPFFVVVLALGATAAVAAPPAAPPAEPIGDERFRPLDVFALEWVSEPQIAPDAGRIVFVRNGMDVMKDRRRGGLWSVRRDGGDLRPLGIEDAGSPRLSPDGKRLAYVARDEAGPQVYVRYLDGGETARLAQLASPPSGLAWSPDGRQLAFSMRVEAAPKRFVEPPTKPEGAEWAEPPRVIEKLVYREDGSGYVEDGFDQLFVVPAEGGAPRQLTSGPYDHRGPLSWSPDGGSLLFSANRREDAERQPLESEVYELRLADRAVTQLTDRRGPDATPVVSPDGRLVAYTGFDDREQGYQVTHLYLMHRDGSGAYALTADFDRDVEAPVWAADGKALYFRYDDRGVTKVGRVALDGQVTAVAAGLAGDIGRPYSGGSFTVAKDGTVAFTLGRPDHLPELGVAARGATLRATQLSRALFAGKELGAVEGLVVRSSHDGREIEAWLVKPPGFDGAKKYPLILEIHGGPFANYGERFSSEIQLYAAAGYVVVYANPRGSTGYGEGFGNLIHHDYPGHDFEDLMTVVDATIARGFVDPEELYVTGGSGGGVLTAWIVGKTPRFRAAVVAKPVINWASFVLTADGAPFFARYWFGAYPWEDPESYFRRSPLAYAGNVETPTLLLTGEEDYRTPISESEQLYQALRLRGVDTALVRVPGAGHDIAARPSQLVAKVAHVLEWFRRHAPGAGE